MTRGIKEASIGEKSAAGGFSCFSKANFPISITGCSKKAERQKRDEDEKEKGNFRLQMKTIAAQFEKDGEKK